MLYQAAQQFVAANIADTLKKADCPNLAELVQLRPDGRLPLLVVTFTFFFRAELRHDDGLRNELSFDILENLSAGQMSTLQLLSEQSKLLARVERKEPAGDLRYARERVGVDGFPVRRGLGPRGPGRELGQLRRELHGLLPLRGRAGRLVQQPGLPRPRSSVRQ